MDGPPTPRAALDAWATAGLPGERRQETLLWILRARPDQASLSLSFFRLRSLPPRLAEFLPQLSQLYFRGNRLSEAPDFSALSRLREIDLGSNAFTTSPDLRALAQLEVVDLGGNRLRRAPDVDMFPMLRRLSLHYNMLSTPPDVTRCRSLEELHLAQNELIAMPDVRGLDNLQQLNLRGNQLRTVPPWITDLPGTLTIDLTGNPLSRETIDFLNGLHTGPRIDYGQEVTPHDGPPASLPEQIGIWLATQSAARSLSDDQRQSLQERWTCFARETDAGTFARLLRELTRTADFQNSAASRQALGQRAADVLDALARDDELRRLCFTAAREGLGTCGDRVALTFSEIEVAARATTLTGKPDGLLKLAHGMHRLALVDEIARKDLSSRRGGVDEVEVVLGYRVKLAEALGLPAQPGHMLYERCAKLGVEQLEQAKQSVLAREQANPDALIESIAGQSFWQASLRQQPACAEEIALLDAQRTQQDEALQLLHEQARARATQEERESELSELNLGYDNSYGAINRHHGEGVRATYRQFTRIATDRVAVGQPAFDTVPTPAHVIAAAKVADIATRLRALRRQDQTEEARTLASQLLQPALVAGLHHAAPSTMSTREAKAMDIANVQYMELLRTLATDDLLDAGEVFDLLLGINPPPDHEETPYLMHIASRAGAVQRDTPDTAPQLAHAVTQLLHTLAETRKIGEAQTRQDVRADMRRALLTQDHARQTTELGRQKYEKYIDFYARLLLSASPSEPGKTAKSAARELAIARLLPTCEEIRAAGLSEVRAGKFKHFFEKAAGPGRPAPSSEAREESGENLDKVVQALGQLNIAGAHAMRLQQLAIETELQHKAEARASIRSAVRGAVDAQWEAGTRQTRRALAPHGLAGMLDPVGAAAYASAARSVRATAPGGIADKVCDALLATPEGRAVLHGLVATRRPYSAERYPEFEDMLRHTAGRDVRLELAHAESRLRGRARATIATARARDAAARAAHQSAQRAETDAQTRRVQAHAGQQERGPEIASGGLPSTRGASSSVKQARPGHTTTQARSDRGSAEESAQTLTMPIVPDDPIGTTVRLATRPMDR